METRLFSACNRRAMSPGARLIVSVTECIDVDCDDVCTASTSSGIVGNSTRRLLRRVSCVLMTAIRVSTIKVTIACGIVGVTALLYDGDGTAPLLVGE